MTAKKKTDAPKGKKKAATKKTTTPAAPKAEKGRVLKRKPRAATQDTPESAKPTTAKPERQAKTEAAPATAAAPTTPRSLADLREKFCANLTALAKSESTIKSYAADLKVAEKHFGPEKLVAEISAEEAQAFIDSPRVNLGKNGERRSQITIDKVVRVFRQAIDFAVSEAWITQSPLPSYERKARTTTATTEVSA